MQFVIYFPAYLLSLKVNVEPKKLINVMIVVLFHFHCTKYY